MARCALVQTSDNKVINVIVAEVGVYIPADGFMVVDIENFPYADIGWFYDPVLVDFVPPPSEVTDGN